MLALPTAVHAQTTAAPPSSTVTTSTATFSGSDLDLSPQELETLVSRIALYPDDLLALVLSASTQPLQIVEAQRLLDQRKSNPKVQPPKTWDPSVVALLNYPEAVTLLNQDLTWTQQLGTSVINQQTAVMDAVQSFRKKVLEAGNLTSDDKRTVTVESQTIVVQPANPQVIYVPSYNPTTVIYAAGPGYPPPYYYSPPYPYYYNPAATFFTGAVFGAAVGFALAWDDHDIYHGDIYHGGVNVNNVNINRNVNVNNVQNRVNNVDRSSVSNKIERNRENVWRPERTSVNRASAGSARATAAVDPEQIRSGLTARSGQPPAANRTQARAGASARAGTQDSRPQRAGAADAAKRSQPVERRQASASGAFSGVDRPAKTEQFSKRGAESLGHGGGAGRSRGASGGGGNRAGGGGGHAGGNAGGFHGRR